MRVSIASPKAVVTMLMALACSATAHAAGQLDFDDCDVLAGKSHAAEFNRTMADERRAAEGGDLDARRFLAGVANNHFACLAEAIGGDGTGWSVTVSSDDAGSNGGNHGGQNSQTTTRLAAGELIRKNRTALNALHEARDRAQAVADADAGYRSMAAQFVADYPGLFADADRVAAYRDAAGTAALSCGRPAVLGKDRSAALCSGARAQLAGLTPYLAAAQRSAADAAGRQWAAAYVEPSAR